jgi:hypothetical protein
MGIILRKQFTYTHFGKVIAIERKYYVEGMQTDKCMQVNSNACYCFVSELVHKYNKLIQYIRKHYIYMHIYIYIPSDTCIYII